MKQKYFPIKWLNLEDDGERECLKQYFVDNFKAFTGVNKTLMLVNKDDRWCLTFCRQIRKHGFGSYHNEYRHYILSASNIQEILALKGTFIITNRELSKLNKVNDKLVQDVLKTLSVMVL